jgi:hypothetical protein
MLEAKGHNGQVQFDGDHVTITRKGLLGRMSVGKGDKRWHISQISSIQWKPAGPLVNGFIQLSASGGNEQRSRFGSQTTSAVQDENSVIFTKKQMPDFEKLRAALDTAIAAQHARPAAAPAGSAADEITKLAGLRDQGLIRDDEYETQKKRLLEG